MTKKPSIEVTCANITVYLSKFEKADQVCILVAVASCLGIDIHLRELLNEVRTDEEVRTAQRDAKNGTDAILQRL